MKGLILFAAVSFMQYSFCIGITCSSAGLPQGCCTGNFEECHAGSCYCDQACKDHKDCCRDVPTQLPCVTIRSELLQAIKIVESYGDVNAVGDGGDSIGPFQIQKSYWEDAAQYDSSLRAGGKTYQNCYGAGSIKYSQRVIQAYMNRYAKSSRLGHPATDEDIARIHNGGPNGYKRKSTLVYWNKVRAYIKRDN